MTESTKPNMEIECVAHDTGQHLMTIEIRVTQSIFAVTQELLTKTLYDSLGAILAKQAAKPPARACPFYAGAEKDQCNEGCAEGVCLLMERWNGRNR